MKKTVIPAAALLFVLLACGKTDRASAVVTAFSHAMADSAYDEAWEMLTPETRSWYDSTLAILREFGWTESRGAITELAGEMTEEDFLQITGKDIFVRMAESSEDVHNLSSSIKSVSYPDSLLGVVVVRTEEGLQEIIVRKIGDRWLIDLTSLMPPVEGG
ncbi:MAG: hypothetical protein GF388_01685 [Candidatus Aegiribacteria sp.]|nr:hypothetical protein [Candidatus Aegiribacteria sp.]MBD3294085.1 hypothetical protein [Candidatus Fermentibacteria bacterium]